MIARKKDLTVLWHLPIFHISSKNAPGSFLLLVAMPGAPSSVLVPSSDALCY